MNRVTLLAIGLIALSVAIFAMAPARAGVVVELNPHPISHGKDVTLADLFDGAEGPSGTVSVGPAAPVGQATVLDAGRVQVVAHGAGLDWNNDRGLRRVIVEAGAPDQPVAPERPAATGRSAAARNAAARNASARTAGRAAPSDVVQALVYARNIPTGDAVGAEDLIWADLPATSRLSEPLADPEIVVGRVARRPLRAGAVASIRDLIGAKVIHRDDVVFVTFQDDGVTLTLQGRAQADAAVGDTVQVMNSTSKKMVEAVASAPGHAVVGPAAEALKSMSAAPNRYASAR